MERIAAFRLERFFAAHEFKAPYLLCCSDCESYSIGELLALEPEAAERLKTLWLGYTQSQGDPELRENIAGLYENLSAAEILVHAGAEEAIFNFMHVVLEPGDQVVVQAPYYQSLGEVARSLGAEVLEWQGEAARGWEPDLSYLRRLITPRTRVVVVNLPHNPTGFLPHKGFLEELSALSENHGFLVFSDEVYRGLEAAPGLQLPSFADINERAVSLGVMSKTYGLAGLRIGWVATRNKALLEKLAAFKDYTTICNSAPSEFLASLALRHHRVIVERNLRIIRENLDQLDAFFAAHEELFDWQRPQAGPIAFPGLRKGCVEHFCRLLLQQSGVLLLPGTLYSQGLNYFRIGFGRRNLPQGLARLAEFLAHGSWPP